MKTERDGYDRAFRLRVSVTEELIEVRDSGRLALSLTKEEATVLHAQLAIALGLVPVVEISDDPPGHPWP